MCGIVGTLDWGGDHPPDIGLLCRMLGSIRHRGPDEFGLYVDQQAGVGCARLSIVDLSTGQQPIANRYSDVIAQWLGQGGDFSPWTYLTCRWGSHPVHGRLNAGDAQASGDKKMIPAQRRSMGG